MQKVKEKSNWKGETIVEIEIERLKAFRHHPFQVRDDDDLEKLKEAQNQNGEFHGTESNIPVFLWRRS